MQRDLSAFEERGLVQPDSSAFVADPDLIRILVARSTPVDCAGGAVLFNQDETASGIYILLDGAGTLAMRSRDGRTIFSIPTMQGSLLGLPALISNQPYSLSATANAGADVRFISRDDFMALMQSDPLLSLKMLQVLAAEVRTARKALY